MISSILVLLTIYSKYVFSFERTLVNHKMPIRVLINKEFCHCVDINLASIGCRMLRFIEIPKVLSTFHLDITSKEIIFLGVDVKDVLVLFDKTFYIYPNERHKKDGNRVQLQLFLLGSLNCLFFANERLS